MTAAAMANWNDTTPDASLISASPDSSDFWRPVSRMSLPNAVTATASVGPSAAPSAKAAASGMDGSIQLSTKPTTNTVTITSPMASDTMEPLLSHNPRLLACRDSSKSSGAMNSTKNSSGSIATSTGVPTSRMTIAPIAICTSGNDTRGIIWSSTADTSTAANSSNTNSSISMGIHPSARRPPTLVNSHAIKRTPRQTSAPAKRHQTAKQPNRKPNGNGRIQPQARPAPIRHPVAHMPSPRTRPFRRTPGNFPPTYHLTYHVGSRWEVKW